MVLRELTPNDELAFFEGMKAWSEPISSYSFIWKEGMTYLEMLEELRKEKLGIDLKPGYVPHTMLYLFLNDEIVGRVSVRHKLNKDLKTLGHIGYVVSKNHRGQGLGTWILEETIHYCKTLNLKSVMLTCAENNVASWQIIEKCGGKIKDVIFDEKDKEKIRRYLVKVS